MKAIVIKRGKAEIGTIENDVFISEGGYSGDIPEGYKPFFDFLRLSYPDVTKKQSEEVRKRIGYTKIYIYLENHDKYWAYYNHKCMMCQSSCKQSSMVEVMSCPQYKEIE